MQCSLDFPPCNVLKLLLYSWWHYLSYMVCSTVVSWWAPMCNILFLHHWINIVVIISTVVALVFVVYLFLFSFCNSRTRHCIWELPFFLIMIFVASGFSLQNEGSYKRTSFNGLTFTACQLICCNKSIFHNMYLLWLVQRLC